MSALIAGVLTQNTVEGMLESAWENQDNAEIFEVRLDLLNSYEGIKRLGEIKKQFIVTCMPKWEGGAFIGGEEDRIKVLNKKPRKKNIYIALFRKISVISCFMKISESRKLENNNR